MSSFWGAPSVNAETSFKYGQEPAGAFAVRRPKTHFRAVVLPTIRPLRISASMVPSLPRQLGSRTALTFPWDALNARRPKSDLRVSPYRAYADLQGHLQLRNSRTRIPWRFLPPATALPFDTARPQSLASSEFWRFSSFRHDWHLWS